LKAVVCQAIEPLELMTTLGGVVIVAAYADGVVVTLKKLGISAPERTMARASRSTFAIAELDTASCTTNATQ